MPDSSAYQPVPRRSTSKTYEQLYAEFLAYHAANPRVYSLVKEFCDIAIANGHRHYAIATIWERIRWEMTVVNRSNIDGEDFKMPNNHRAHYARMWLNDHPEHNGEDPFFQTCELRSARPGLKLDRYGRTL